MLYVNDMTQKNKKYHLAIPWYKDKNWIISTIISAFIGPIIVGCFLLYLGNKFNKSLENIKDQLFIKYSNAPQIWGYDPIEFSTDNIFHDFQFGPSAAFEKTGAKPTRASRNFCGPQAKLSEHPGRSRVGGTRNQRRNDQLGD